MIEKSFGLLLDRQGSRYVVQDLWTKESPESLRRSALQYQ